MNLPGPARNPFIFPYITRIIQPSHFFLPDRSASLALTGQHVTPQRATRRGRRCLSDTAAVCAWGPGALCQCASVPVCQCATGDAKGNPSVSRRPRAMVTRRTGRHDPSGLSNVVTPFALHTPPSLSLYPSRRKVGASGPGSGYSPCRAMRRFLSPF
jgi:hypothetical protein